MTKGQGNKETSHPLNKTSMNMLIGSHEKKTKQESSRFYLELRYFALGYSALKKEKKKKKKKIADCYFIVTELCSELLENTVISSLVWNNSISNFSITHI